MLPCTIEWYAYARARSVAACVCIYLSVCRMSFVRLRMIVIADSSVCPWFEFSTLFLNANYFSTRRAVTHHSHCRMRCDAMRCDVLTFCVLCCATFVVATNPALKDTPIYRYNGIALVCVFFVFRVILNACVVYHMIVKTWRVHVPLIYVKSLPFVVLALSLTTLAAGHMILNLIWFIKIVGAATRKLSRNKHSRRPAESQPTIAN